MSFSPAFLQALSSGLAPENILTDPAACWVYSYDNSRHRAVPAAVLFARRHEEIVHIVKCCHEYQVPIVVRGRGTGTPGGSVPIAPNSVVLSLEKMHEILEIDPGNRYIRVQTGVLNQRVQEAVAPHGFFWAPDPSSAAFCTVGGNLGYNAAGPRAVKYGSTREHVLGLTAVLGTGETIHTGACTSKGAVGYDLTRLLIGSEGTLAIITEAILKLTPLPETKTTLRAIYKDVQSAVQAVINIMAQAHTPCALEFMDNTCLQLIQAHGVDLPANAGAMLLIDVDGDNAEIPIAVESIRTAANNAGLLLFQLAENPEHAKQLWAARKALSPALRNLAPKKINEDVVVPVTKIPQLLEMTATLSEKYGILIVNFGHAGNGNIHVNLLVDPQQTDTGKSEACLNKVFETVIQLGGTLSGEHGIGIEKRAFINKAIDATTLNVMRAIKQQFDPRGILNPGKIFG